MIVQKKCKNSEICMEKLQDICYHGHCNKRCTFTERYTFLINWEIMKMWHFRKSPPCTGMWPGACRILLLPEFR